MEKFKEVAHLYLGCEAIRVDHNLKVIWDMESILFFERGEYKLLLRPLSDMQEDEQIVVGLISRGIELSEATYTDKIFAKEFAFSWAVRKGSRPVMSVADCVKLTTYLLKQGFDLFGLIESGEAIDKTKNTNHAN